MLFIKNQMVLSVTMVTEFRGDESLGLTGPLQRKTDYSCGVVCFGENDI
jgi:hypothetical protein